MLFTNQIAGFFKLYFLQKYSRYNINFLHIVRCPKLTNVIFVGFGQACLGMLNLLLSNKVPISLGTVELFCLFVACSYTSMEATVLSCHFIWVWSWSCVPKVLRNNKSPISLERV